ncbi:hypothetical protein [Rhodococcus opacus]|uniref:hypothetical protein n=1 Tax=Rhodococcus opacus TaxID=37919 RepID=UPI001F51788B|nr:hypothetical protein [Rhodococcus opacus]
MVGGGLHGVHRGGRARPDGRDATAQRARACCARILAQQARADEMPGMLRRGSDSQSEVDFSRHSTVLSEILAQHRNTSRGGVADAPVVDAATALDGWRDTHTVLQDRLGTETIRGRPPSPSAPATTLTALGPPPDPPAPTYRD